MALNNNFYNEIFENEKYWIELANKKLLNIYYLNGKNGLKEFYVNKKKELELEYKLTNNDIIKQFLDIINSIIREMEYLTDEYRKGELIDMNSLVNLFLYNQMNNNVNENKKSKDIVRLQMERQILQSLRKKYRNQVDEYDTDYLYEEPDYKAKSA